MRIQTTCGRGDSHLEGIYGLPVSTKIDFTVKDMELKFNHNVWSNGIYHDHSSKGAGGGRHDCFRAEVRADGVRIRRRFKTRELAQSWIDNMVSKKKEA